MSDLDADAGDDDVATWGAPVNVVKVFMSQRHAETLTLLSSAATSRERGANVALHRATQAQWRPQQKQFYFHLPPLPHNG
jgi:hypothetical protein